MWSTKGDTIAKMHNGIWKQKHTTKCEKENILTQKNVDNETSIAKVVDF